MPGGGGWRDGVAVLGGTVSVRPGTVTVRPGSVTVWPGSVTEGVPRTGYRGPSKTTSIWDIVFEILTTNKETTPDVTTS